MKKKIKVCHLTSAHNRYDVRIFIKECNSLVEANYKVSLIVADGLGDEIVSGINIYDVGKKKGRFNRFFSSAYKVYKKAKLLKCDIYHFHDPELMFYGLLLKSKKNKVIYDIHEDLTKQLEIKPWINKLLKPIVIFLFIRSENFVTRKMDALIVPQPYMESKYLKVNANTTLVENFVIIKEDESSLEIDYSNKVAFHAGALTSERGLFNMVNAYFKLDYTNKLILAGNMTNSLLLKVNNFQNYPNVDYLGILPHDQVSHSYYKSSIGLILYNNVGQYYLSYAIKLFEYMLKGIPVIMPDFGEWVEFNKINECGINVNPADCNAVTKAIDYLNNNISEKKRLGKNGQKAVLEKYNWDISKGRLLDLYKNLMLSN